MPISKTGGNQSLDRMTKQALAVVSKQFFCLRIDEDDFPRSICDDHRVWHRLKQLTEGLEDCALHSNLIAHTLSSLLESELAHTIASAGFNNIAPSELPPRNVISRMF